jgi:ABC-2 type transport system ATP-binding protein
VGGDRLEVRLEDSSQCEAASSALAAMANGSPSLEDTTLRVPLRTRTGAIAEAVRRLDDRGIGIADIALRTPTLDDAFLRLTGHVADAPGEGERREQEHAA